MQCKNDRDGGLRLRSLAVLFCFVGILATLRLFMKVATVFMNAATAEQSCKALRLRLSGTPPRGAVYPTGV